MPRGHWPITRVTEAELPGTEPATHAEPAPNRGRCIPSNLWEASDENACRNVLSTARFLWISRLFVISMQHLDHQKPRAITHREVGLIIEEHSRQVLLV